MAGALTGKIKVNIAHQTAAVETVNAHIYDYGTWFDPATGDKVAFADGNHQKIGAAEARDTTAG